MNGALSAWLIAAPAGGAVLAALSIFFGGSAGWVRRLASFLGFGGALLAAVESFLRLRNAGFMTSNLGGWAPPWGVEIRLDASMAWMLLGLILAVWLTSQEGAAEGEGKARRLSLRLLFLSGASSAMLIQDAASRNGAVLLTAMALAGLLTEDKNRVPVEGVRPPFDFFMRVAVGMTVVWAGAVFLFARTGTFDLGGWQSRVQSAVPLPEVGAAFLLMVIGYWILSGAWPAPGWEGSVWLDSPAGVPERVWFSRLVLWLAASTATHLAVEPVGLSALRFWEATRWLAWGAFAISTLMALSSPDRRKTWGLLDLSGLFLIWALSNAGSGVIAAMVFSQAFGLTLGATAPPTHRLAGIWVLKGSLALLLPGWWILSLAGGWVAVVGSWAVGSALLWFSFVALRVVQPLAANEATSASSERGFLAMWFAACAGFLLLLVLR